MTDSKIVSDKSSVVFDLFDPEATSLGEQPEPEGEAEPTPCKDLTARPTRSYTGACSRGMASAAMIMTFIGLLVSFSVEVAKEVDEEENMLVIPLQRQTEKLKVVGQRMQYKSAYYGTVSAGGQEFTVVFDTGSGQLVLPSTYCRSKTCKMHKRYSRKASNTGIDMNIDGELITDPSSGREMFTVGFGTGSIDGLVIDELVCLGKAAEHAKSLNIADSSQPLPNGCFRMRMLAATTMTADPFDTFAFDGIMGLALPSVSPELEFNLNHVLGSHMPKGSNGMSSYFAIFLAQTEGETSEITFGGYRKGHVDGDVHWQEVHEPEHGHWMLKIKGLRVDDTPVSYCSDGDCKAVLDTGTALLGVSSESFAEVYSYMWHPTSMDGSCDGSRPVFTVELESGLDISISPRDFAAAVPYTDAQVTQNAELPFPWGRPWSGGEEEYLGRDTRFDLQCKPLLMSMDFEAPLGPKLFILGEPFLRKYYAIYDSKAKRVGLATAKHPENQLLDPLGIHRNHETTSDLGMDWFFDDNLLTDDNAE